MIVAVPVEMISGTVAFQILKLSNSNENVIASIPVLIMIIICYMIIASLLYVFKKKRNINLQFNNRFIGINIALVFLMVGPNIIFYTLNKYNYPMWLLIYNVISNIVLVILAIYNTHKQIKLEKTEIDLKNSNAENAKLQNLNDNIRTFKHDYNNVVHAIGGYIRMNDIGGLEKYYLGLKKDVDKVNTLENITAEKINEPSVLALISTKCQEAYEKNISFNIESIFNYQNLDMPIYDFCKILGVLLDNAIEAAEETEEKEINIVVRQSNKTKIQLFSIENTYLLKDIDTEKIYEKDYSTKNRNSGIGLWEVRKIVERNDNVILNTDKDDKYFRQELYIQIREKPEKDKKQRETLTTS
ncbi:MAG: GHKL domain-containing protein [Clostridia bacterium]|nr:GHKL domain-containing protein [Clostridia bacterium]